MSTTNTSNTTSTAQTSTFRIASMDLVDFSTKLQEAVLQGYKLDFSNENCPIQLGTLLTCCLVKDHSPVKETSTEAHNEAYKASEKQGSTEVPSEEQKPSRGRKPASKTP